CVPSPPPCCRHPRTGSPARARATAPERARARTRHPRCQRRRSRHRGAAQPSTLGESVAERIFVVEEEGRTGRDEGAPLNERHDGAIRTFLDPAREPAARDALLAPPLANGQL